MLLRKEVDRACVNCCLEKRSHVTSSTQVRSGESWPREWKNEQDVPEPESLALLACKTQREGPSAAARVRMDRTLPEHSESSKGLLVKPLQTLFSVSAMVLF